MERTFRERIKNIAEGTLIVVFSAILIGAGSIVWTASTSYKEDMKSYFEASTEVFSTDIAELSSGQRSLKADLANQNALLVEFGSSLNEIRSSLDELWDLANSENDYAKMSMIESNDMSYGEDSMLEEIVIVAEEPVIVEEFQMSAPPPAPTRTNRVIQQQQIPQDYQTYKKADIKNRIQEAQQQIQQQR